MLGRHTPTRQGFVAREGMSEQIRLTQGQAASPGQPAEHTNPQEERHLLEGYAVGQRFEHSLKSQRLEVAKPLHQRKFVRARVSTWHR